MGFLMKLQAARTLLNVDVLLRTWALLAVSELADASLNERMATEGLFGPVSAQQEKSRCEKGCTEP